jgi:beta-mannanase
VAVALCGAAVLAQAVAWGNGAADGRAAGEGGPSVSFRAPGEAEAGAQVVAQGRVAGLGSRGSVQAQLLSGGRWRTLSRLSADDGRFRIKLRLPGQGAMATLRGAVFVAGKRVAASALSRVRLARPRAVVPAPVATPSAAPPPSPEPPIEPPDPIYWGAAIDRGMLPPGTPPQPAPIIPTTIGNFEAFTHKSLSLLESFSAFAECSGSNCTFIPFPAKQLEEIRNRGAIPVFTWASEATSGERHQPNFQLRDVIEGKYDSYISSWATAAKAWGHPFFLRFDWEMNGNWYPWAVGTVPQDGQAPEKAEEGKVANGNVPSEYVEAWQHVHQLFTAAGATNPSWVWCPYINPNNNKNLASLEQLYPGDEYVDWTCLDGYNYGTLKSNTKWRTFAELFGPQYTEITATMAPTKPMLIGEVASSEQGGSKPAWISEMFSALPNSFPAVRGLMWFDYLYESNDWWLESSTAAEQAFAAGISDPRYVANTVGGLASSPIPPP